MLFQEDLKVFEFIYFLAPLMSAHRQSALFPFGKFCSVANLTLKCLALLLKVYFYGDFRNFGRPSFSTFSSVVELQLVRSFASSLLVKFQRYR